MPVFEKLLHDADDRVRMEAPEIFRVLGKRRPELVRPYVELLQRISETDSNRVVRIHCLGAIKATGYIRAYSANRFLQESGATFLARYMESVARLQKVQRRLPELLYVFPRRSAG